MARILVGTAAWTDPALIKCGRFYPKGCNTAEDRLRFYASQFPIVEVNSSYYAVPNPQTAQLWAERTPASFLSTSRRSGCSLVTRRGPSPCRPQFERS